MVQTNLLSPVPSIFFRKAIIPYGIPGRSIPSPKKSYTPGRMSFLKYMLTANLQKQAIRYSTGKTFAKGEPIFVNGAAAVTLEASDELSGVENIYYSLDGESYTIYSAPVEMREEREYLLTYFAADHVGNAEKPKEVRIVPDLAAPQTSLEISGDRFENILSGRSKILLKAEDKGMGVERIMYRIDGEAWRNYQLPVNAGILEQGEHTLAYYAVDLTGNREEEKTFTVQHR